MKTVCVMMSLMAIIATSTFGQSIADQLLVAECSFRLFNGSTELNVIDQMVTSRAVASSKEELNSSVSAYHLEFTYKGAEMKLKSASVEFLDEKKRPLHAIQLEDPSRYMKVDTLGHRPNPKTRYVVISLQGVPLRLLDKVASIRISGGQ